MPTEEETEKNSDDLQIPPGRDFSKTVIGKGSGGGCALCGIAIAPSEMEYEVVWSRDGNTRRSHFHLVCYELWWSQQA